MATKSTKTTTKKTPSKTATKKVVEAAPVVEENETKLEATEEVVEESAPVVEEPTYTFDVVPSPRIAKFFKVSFETFVNAYKPAFIVIEKVSQGIDPTDPTAEFAYSEEKLIQSARTIYDSITLPKRATAGSAGYDFFFPFGHTELPPGTSILIPTGIKCDMAPGWCLKEYPRSSLGFNYRFQMDNTVGIIDQDYFNNPKNEGHIFLKMTNDNRDGLTLMLELGMAVAQGIFEQYGITVDDECTDVRTGGIGSTDN